MTDPEIWSHMEQFGNIRPLWWYSIVVMPALIISFCTYLLMWFVLVRRRDNLTTMLFWLVVASLPILLILPSFYACIATGSALAYLGVEPRPTVVQDLGLATTQTLGRDLGLLAWLGLAGSLLAIVIVVIIALISGFRYTPPMQRRTESPYSRSYTAEISGILTETFESRPRQVSAPYGIIRVISGQRKGTLFGITGNVLIGKHKANLTINDTIVSRQHARIEVRAGSVYLVDIESRNGTYLRRNGAAKEQEVKGQPMQLQSGDTIFLGNPDLPQAVQLLYERIAADEDDDLAALRVADDQPHKTPSVPDETA